MTQYIEFITQNNITEEKSESVKTFIRVLHKDFLVKVFSGRINRRKPFFYGALHNGGGIARNGVLLVLVMF